MSYNKENYARIRQAYQTKYLKAYAEADRRTEHLHQQSPELAALDRELASAGVEIAMAALRGGEEREATLARIEARNLALQEKRAALLLSMGYPSDYTLPPYECPKCNDTGFVDAKMCECMRRDLILAAHESSGLGSLMQRQSFDNFDLSYYGANAKSMGDKLEFLKQYAQKFSEGASNLILMGPTGLGKTHLSTAMARTIIDRGFDVFYTGAIEMFADFEKAKFGMGEAKKDAADQIARYTECDLLILDDLGTETCNQFTASCLYLVLNTRINLRRTTIINTNLDYKEIQSRYADRITSRLFGEFLVIGFSGTDIRRQKLNKK